MSGVNKSAGKGQGKIYHDVVAEEKVTLLPKKTLVTSENVTTIKEVDKDTKTMDHMKELVVTISRKYLSNFEGPSKQSTGWFNPYHES